MEEGKGRKSMLPSFFTKDELEIGDILLDLQNPIPLSIHKPVPEFPYTPRSSSFSPPWISHHSTEIKPKIVDNVQAPSPVMSLSFPTNRSDQETKYSSKKRGRKEYIQQFTEMGEILKRGVEKVKNYYNQLQAENIELKERKRKMLLKREEEIKNKSLRNIGFISSGQKFGICTQQQMNSLMLQDQQRQYSKLFPSSTSAQSSPPPSLNQPIGPRGIPDLNVSAEETFGLDSFQPLDKDTKIITRESPKEKRLMRRIFITKKRNGHR